MGRTAAGRQNHSVRRDSLPFILLSVSSLIIFLLKASRYRGAKRGGDGKVLCIVDLSVRSRKAIRLTLRSLYSPIKNPSYRFSRSLGSTWKRWAWFVKPCLHDASWLARVKCNSQVASNWSLSNFPQLAWNVYARITGTWLARANLHRVNAALSSPSISSQALTELLRFCV